MAFAWCLDGSIKAVMVNLTQACYRDTALITHDEWVRF